MRQRTVRLAQDVRAWFRVGSLEELWMVARELRCDLDRRALDARLEAAALELALLVELGKVEKAIYSEDCSCEDRATHEVIADTVDAIVRCRRPAEES